MAADLQARLPGRGSLPCAAWADQAMWWSERYRSRALLWPVGEQWFVNDPLGPMPHTHPGASEIYFLAAGEMEVEVGRKTVRLRAGVMDFLFIPPDTYHHPHHAGDDHVCLLGMVAPNYRDLRGKFADFTDADMEGAPLLGATSAVGGLPGDGRLVSTVLELAPGEETGVERVADADRLIYVLGGEATVTVEHLSGALASHDYLNVMAGVPHNVVNKGERSLRILSVWANGDANARGGAPR